MIYTLTLNPSLDYNVSVENFYLGTVNRTIKEYIYPGGKGINVSMVLKNLGYESTALGFIAGFTGEELERCLRDKKIHTSFVKIQKGLTRINVKIHSTKESEINGQGPVVGTEEMKALYQLLSQLKQGDILVLSGSAPKSLPATIYRDIMRYFENKQIKIILDASKELLLYGLQFSPFLIKPNHHELGEIFGLKLNEREEMIQYARNLQSMGARNVLVSMAGDGAVLITEEGTVYTADAPPGEVKNSVGAGDSMVAGFIAGYLKSNDYEQAFRMGLCAGSASAFSEELATADEIMQLLSISK